MKPYPGPIALRLTLGLGLISLVVFAGAGVALQRTLDAELNEADRTELSGKVGVVRHFIDEFAADRDQQALQHHLDDVLIGHQRLSLRIRRADGSDVYRGAGLPAAGAAAVDGFGLVIGGDGTRFETVQALLGNDSPWPGGTISLGLDTRPRDELLLRHRNALIGVCALGIVLTAALSSVAIWRGLAPVKRLSDQAGRITAHSLDLRLVDHHNATELDGLVEAFNAVLDRLEAAYRQMEAFSANVAHELRTPLATLISGSQLMLSGQRSPDELKEAIGSNLEELQQMSRLVNDMLFLAHADQGASASGLGCADLGAEVDRTLKYCQPLLDDAGLSSARSGTAVVECNLALMQRALVNLLVNAVRHTDSGECIVVRIETQGADVRLSVENPGPPIPDHVRARMFDRFFRGDDSRARAGESHGLGLTIVAAIARMHGGTVFADHANNTNRVGLVVPAQARHDPSPG